MSSGGDVKTIITADDRASNVFDQYARNVERSVSRIDSLGSSAQKLSTTLATTKDALKSLGDGSKEAGNSFGASAEKLLGLVGAAETAYSTFKKLRGVLAVVGSGLAVVASTAGAVATLVGIGANEYLKRVTRDMDAKTERDRIAPEESVAWKGIYGDGVGREYDRRDWQDNRDAEQKEINRAVRFAQQRTAAPGIAAGRTAIEALRRQVAGVNSSKAEQAVSEIDAKYGISPGQAAAFANAAVPKGSALEHWQKEREEARKLGEQQFNLEAAARRRLAVESQIATAMGKGADWLERSLAPGQKLSHDLAEIAKLQLFGVLSGGQADSARAEALLDSQSGARALKDSYATAAERHAQAVARIQGEAGLTAKEKTDLVGRENRRFGQENQAGGGVMNNLVESRSLSRGGGATSTNPQLAELIAGQEKAHQALLDAIKYQKALADWAAKFNAPLVVAAPGTLAGSGED